MKPTDPGVMETAATTAANVVSGLTQTTHEASELGKAAARLAEQTVRENPWRAIGIAASVGLLIGLVLRR